MVETQDDRVDESDEVTVLASAVRAATNNTADQRNYNSKGILVVFDVTVVPTIDTVQLILQAKDPASGKYIDLFVDATQVAVVTRSVIIRPGTGAAADGIDATRDYSVPRTFRIRIVHVGVGNFTYSVGYSMLN